VTEAYGSGKWKQPGVPHKGWTCIGMTDLGEPIETCEMCESQEIRYVHEMSHPEYPGYLGVGCVCAEHMEAVSTAARKREADFKSRWKRRAKWLTRRWHGAIRGDAQMLRSRGWEVHVFPFRTGWSASVEFPSTYYRRPASRIYPTRDAAKLAAFDAIEILRERGTHRQ
jgi:hypothetical protein